MLGFFSVYFSLTDAVLKAPRDLTTENLSAVTAVAEKTFLVSETMEQIIWFDGSNQIKLYSIA